jgi:excisionase family DNA binding protein
MAKDKIVTDEIQLNDLETTAQRLAVSIWTIRRWVQTGQLASLKLGSRRLVAESEIQRAISQGLRDLAA